MVAITLSNLFCAGENEEGDLSTNEFKKELNLAIGQCYTAVKYLILTRVHVHQVGPSYGLGSSDWPALPAQIASRSLEPSRLPRSYPDIAIYLPASATLFDYAIPPLLKRGEPIDTRSGPCLGLLVTLPLTCRRTAGHSCVALFLTVVD